MKKSLSLKQILVTLYDACLCIKHPDKNKIEVSNKEIKNGSVFLEDDLVCDEKKATEGRRIKMVITRKQLNCLLAKQVSLEQLGFVNQRTFFRSFDDNKWKPRLESIYETPEL